MSGRVIRVAPRRERAPEPAPVRDTLHPEMAAPQSAPVVSAPPPVVNVPPPVVNVAPPVVNMDTAELAKQLAANNDLLRQVLAELQRKKQWRFDLARDQMGRPFQIDANEV